MFLTWYPSFWLMNLRATLRVVTESRYISSSFWPSANNVIYLILFMCSYWLRDISLTELCSSIMQSLTQTPSSSPTPSTTGGGRTSLSHESGRYTPVTSTPVKERGGRDFVPGSLEQKAQSLPPRRKISMESRLNENERKTQHQSTPPRTTSVGRKVSQVAGGHGVQQEFTLPNMPPKMADWMPDHQVTKCVICGDKFSMVRTVRGGRVGLGKTAFCSLV